MNVISLCSGYGGLDLALRLVFQRVRTLCYVERESYAASTLVARMEDQALDTAPVWDDIKTFDGRDYAGRVDILIGGYPCQPFSLAGKRLGQDDERHLWPAIRRIIGEVRPRFCFFENVSGHLSLGFREVREELEADGYLVEAGLFSAAEVGANHERKRLFILAYRGAGIPIKFASDCEPCDCCGEPFCIEHMDHYADCPCIGPDNAEDYGLYLVETADGLLGYPVGSGLEGHSGHGAEGSEPGWQSSEAGGPVSETGSLPSPDWWESEPDVGRVAYGTPNRVDRLIALGNGVVPVVAAKAFVCLAARLTARVESMKEVA